MASEHADLVTGREQLGHESSTDIAGRSGHQTAHGVHPAGDGNRVRGGSALGHAVTTARRCRVPPR